MPLELETLPSVAKAIPKPSDNTARIPPVPFDSSVLPKDSSVSELLEKVASLKQRLSARSLGGLLADEAAKCAAIKYRKREEMSRQRKRRRFSDVSGDTLSEIDKEDTGLVPSRDGNRIQITGEREPGKLLASGLQQVKKLLSQRGGVSNEANIDELATGVLQHLMSVFHCAHPQSSLSLRNSRELRTIAECIVALLAGDLPHLDDLLMQRLKAIQTAVVEGNWNLAQHLELIPTTGSNAVTQAELRQATPKIRCLNFADSQRVAKVTGGRLHADRPKFAHRFLCQLRSRLLPLQKTRPRSSPSFRVATHKNTISPKMITEMRGADFFGFSN